MVDRLSDRPGSADAAAPGPAKRAPEAVRSYGARPASPARAEPAGYRRPPAERRRRPAAPARSKEINIQDGFLFESLKENRLLVFYLVTGQQIEGRIRRFDRYAVLVETGMQQILIYKHTISGISGVGTARPAKFFGLLTTPGALTRLPGPR